MSENGELHISPDEYYSNALHSKDEIIMTKAGLKFYHGVASTIEWKRIDINFEYAFTLFTKAANKNYPDALFWLGQCYFNEEGTTQNFDKAFTLYEQAAEYGIIEATYMLAECYKRGLGVKRDLKKAARLYESCVSSGHLNSIYELGMCYFAGHGVIRDEDKALVLLDKAASLGHMHAEYQLSLFAEPRGGTRTSWEACVIS